MSTTIDPNPTLVRYGPKVSDPEPAPAAAESSSQSDDQSSQPATTPDGSSQEPKPQSAFSADHLARAAQFGLDPDSFKSEASLERVLTLLESNERQQPEATQQKGDEPDADVEPFKVELGDDVEESIVNTIRAMSDHWSGQLKKVKEQARRADHKAEVVSGVTAEQIFEQQISALGEGWKDIFGSGKTRGLDRRTSAYQNRAKLIETIRDLYQVQSSRPVARQPSDEDLFRRSLLISFGDHYEKMIQANIADKLKKTTITSRPEQRRSGENGTPANDPDSRAKAFVKNFFHERQLT